MRRFSVQLLKSSVFGGSAAALPHDLILTPQTWSASDRGGNQQASISAAGSAESLSYLLGWLGDRVEIYNEAGDCCWYGILWDIEVNLGNLVVSLSMDNVYNRIAVIYSYRNADGSEQSATTAWVEDAESILRYGTRELLYGLPSAFSLSADAARDQLLPRFAMPGPILSTQSANSFSASLTAMGDWYKANSVYFQNVDGLEEHLDSGGVQVIGRYITSTGISFAGGNPAPQDTGADDMWDTNANFGGGALILGDTFTISGATAVDADGRTNNGAFTVGAIKSVNQIETEQASFIDETAGATVKISWGDGISMGNIAQKFQVGTPWTVTHIAVMCRKVGSVSDNFRIGLYADNAGVPGLLLAANETVGNVLFTELAWTEFAMDVPVTLVAGTPYWIGIRRTGAANLANGYEVGVDEGLGYVDGNFLVYDGTNWWARMTDADMPFRVIGEIDSTEQMQKALEASGAFLYTLIQVDSDIPIRQYMDSPRSTLDVVEEMMDAGLANGLRMISWVLYDRSVVVNVPEFSSDENLILGGDGKLRYPTGGLYPPGRLVFGRYVDVDSLLLLDAVGIRANRGSAIYVESSSYSADMDRVSIMGEGALDAYKALTVRKG